MSALAKALSSLPQTNLPALRKMAEICDKSQARTHARLLRSTVKEIEASRQVMDLLKEQGK